MSPGRSPFSCGCDTLCQVPRRIRVKSSLSGHVITQNLQRDNVDDGLEGIYRSGNSDGVERRKQRGVVILVTNDHRFPVTSSDLFQSVFRVLEDERNWQDMSVDMTEAKIVQSVHTE